TAKRASMLIVFFFLSTAMAESASASSKQPLANWVILTLFGVGIVCIAASWIIVPIVFARRAHLDDLIDLLKRGTVMPPVTQSYIVIVAVTLAIIDRLDGGKVSTLLGSIAGYVLGQATSHREEEEAARRRTHAEHSLVKPDEKPRPAQQAGTT